MWRKYCTACRLASFSGDTQSQTNCIEGALFLTKLQNVHRCSEAKSKFMNGSMNFFNLKFWQASNASLKWNSAWVNLKQYQSGSKCHHLPSSSLRWYSFGTMENFPTKWNIDAIRPFNSEPHGSFALRRINWFRDYYNSLFFYRRVTTCFRLNWGVKITLIIYVSKRLHILLRGRTG